MCYNFVMDNTQYTKRELFKTVSAVLVLLMDENKVLLQKRKGTGFADGLWDFSASGHVEEGESMKKTVAREVKEELGVEVSEIKFVGLMHNLGEDGIPRYLGVFKVISYSGEPKICEPEKCSELKWFDLNNLPEDMIKTRKLALENIGDSGFYLEDGWN